MPAPANLQGQGRDSGCVRRPKHRLTLQGRLRGQRSSAAPGGVALPQPPTAPTIRPRFFFCECFCLRSSRLIRPCGGSSPYCHQPVSRNLNFCRGLLHRRGFARRLDLARPDGFAGDFVDVPGYRLWWFRFLGHAASIDRKIRRYVRSSSPPLPAGAPGGPLAEPRMTGGIGKGAAFESPLAAHLPREPS